MCVFMRGCVGFCRARERERESSWRIFLRRIAFNEVWDGLFVVAHFILVQFFLCSFWLRFYLTASNLVVQPNKVWGKNQDRAKKRDRKKKMNIVEKNANIALNSLPCFVVRCEDFADEERETWRKLHIPLALLACPTWINKCNILFCTVRRNYLLILSLKFAYSYLQCFSVLAFIASIAFFSFVVHPPPLKATVSCTFFAIHLAILLHIENRALRSHVRLTLVFARIFITISNSQPRSIPNWLHTLCTLCNPNEKAVSAIPLSFYLLQ